MSLFDVGYHHGGNSQARQLSSLTIPRHAIESTSSSTPSSPRSSTETALPFPTPLPRSDFLEIDFSPSTYLSDLAPSRHQILEDLRSDLRVRSQHLSRELLDLVNAHYADFLGLGGSLRGGREKVEEVRVGLMGFQREIEGVREVLMGKEAEIQTLVEERKLIRIGIEKGRALLDWEAKVQALEGRLNITHPYESRTGATIPRSDEEGSESEDDDDDDNEESSSNDDVGGEVDTMLDKMAVGTTAKLKRQIEDFNLMQNSAMRIGMTHPLIVSQQFRLLRIRNTLLIDLSNCLRQTKSIKSKLELITLYRDMDAGKEAVESLRMLKGKQLVV